MDGSMQDAALAGEAATSFSYEEAFSRNLGWVTPAEQQILRGKRIAIAGLGGVGGSHLLTLVRLGIGAFNIADFDRFELANFNRQAGAMTSTLGRPKAETLARMARDINPELDLRVFPEGVDDGNLDDFLDGVDCYVDSLDFFVLDLRLKLFRRLDQRGIPAIIAAPIGMGTGYLVFMPGRMSFEQYFRLEGLPPEKQRVNFALGLTPRGFQRRYLVDLSRLDLEGKRAPSTGLSCELCAGVAAAEALKILLKRGSVRAAPWYHQFDAYRCKWVRGWLPGGNANPAQRLKLALGYRFSARLSRNAAPPAPSPASDLDYILDQARWAPSGDNTQPWRFDILGEDRLVVRLCSTGDVYDYNDGEPTLLAGGFLLETMRIAASGRGRGMKWRYLGKEGRLHSIAVELPPDRHITPDPLLPYIPIRSVDRRAYRLTPLTPAQKLELEGALGDELSIEWHETLAARWRAAATNALATDIRLRAPEAYEVHRRIVDFEQNFSPVGIPAGALGLDPMTVRLMRWLLRDWRRIDRMNRFFWVTAIARLEMDLVPGLRCAAHFAIRAKGLQQSARGPDLLLRSGAAIQRFWLTATGLGLAMQPSLAPLCFASYRRLGTPFTADRSLFRKADALLRRSDPPELFLGRIGRAGSARLTCRSVRPRAADILAS
jgi:molybdopterin/thiamine biosynthesis adenylyltransferase/nitroreductase